MYYRSSDRTEFLFAGEDWTILINNIHSFSVIFYNEILIYFPYSIKYTINILK